MNHRLGIRLHEELYFLHKILPNDFSPPPFLSFDDVHWTYTCYKVNEFLISVINMNRVNEWRVGYLQ